MKKSLHLFGFFWHTYNGSHLAISLHTQIVTVIGVTDTRASYYTETPWWIMCLLLHHVADTLTPIFIYTSLSYFNDLNLYLIVDEWKTNLMSLAILFHLLCAQHVSDINISIFRSLRLCCWITTSVVLFWVCCVLEIWCG